MENGWRTGGERVNRWRTGEHVENRWRTDGEQVENGWRTGGEQVENRWRTGGEPYLHLQRLGSRVVDEEGEGLLPHRTVGLVSDLGVARGQRSMLAVK